MTRNSLFLGLGILSVLILLAIFGLRGGKVADVGSNASPDLAAALERMNDNQDRLAQRLDRLESLLGTSAASLSVRPIAMGTPGTNNGANRNNGLALSLADQQALAAKQRLDMEDRLISDPLSPQWAMANEKVIGSFLSAENLARQQLPVPKAFQAQCHSHLCRISMNFADDAQASQTQAMLLMDIAPNLSSAQTFMVPRPDGTVDMVIFAGDPQSLR